jgi:hypothetical protein
MLARISPISGVRMRHSLALLTAVAMTGLAAFPAAHADSTPPAPSAPCSSAAHRQFDFWVGSWDVSHPGNGQTLGQNRIDLILNDCVLHEHWTGAKGFRGESFSLYDASRGVWHQSWVDQSGGFLALEGGLRGGAMVLSGTSVNAGATTLNRITWTPRADGSVEQKWDSSDDGGKSWSTTFDGIYRRAKS